MEPVVLVAVLSAAALHAAWNAMVKADLDRFLAVTIVTLTETCVALAVLPFVAPPPPAAWPWLAASLAFHTGYNLFLAQAYRMGDLGQVYPIARGSAPLIVALVMATAFGERLSPAASAGVAVLAGGICLMSLQGGQGGRDGRAEQAEQAGRARGLPVGRAVAFALATALFIACYTVTDGIGARAGATPHGYAVWLFLFDGLIMFAILLARRGRKGLVDIRANWRGGAAGGLMAVGGYWIVIWAMASAPIALVATLRETSVLFAAAISVLVLKEPLTRWRAVAACVIVAGAILTRAG
ncbi:EamA family transporter [Nitratidesulfovibrio sp.]|uniref:EamA family transporter n=1 Tax=Nitratidesulfovibrio sp. TaxID=2802297 RepID=UPI00333F28FB